MNNTILNGYPFSVNGNYIVCKQTDTQSDYVNLSDDENKGTFILQNKIGNSTEFQKMNVFQIVDIVLDGDSKKDFPFEVNDKIYVCSTGTIVNWKSKELFYLFRPEHVICKIND